MMVLNLRKLLTDFQTQKYTYCIRNIHFFKKIKNIVEDFPFINSSWRSILQQLLSPHFIDKEEIKHCVCSKLLRNTFRNSSHIIFGVFRFILCMLINHLIPKLTSPRMIQFIGFRQ